VGESGFTFLGTVGYAVRLGPDVSLVSGTPGPTQQTALNVVYGSGVVISLAFGNSL